MDWNFFDWVKEYGLEIGDIGNAPTTPGYYMLFAEQGEFIYVGKANNLHTRLADHFGDDEENERIKGVAKFAFWESTQNIAQAEEAEGDFYDTWVEITGIPPFANKNKPPRSKLTDEDILVVKLRELFRMSSTISKRLK